MGRVERPPQTWGQTPDLPLLVAALDVFVGGGERAQLRERPSAAAKPLGATKIPEQTIRDVEIVGEGEHAASTRSGPVPKFARFEEPCREEDRLDRCGQQG